MDLAKTLIRSVVRAFYETKHVLVIDALMTHSTHSRPEQREGMQRPVNREYYYIEFYATIDAVKYRVLKLTSKVKEMFRPSEEKKDFRCPHCKAHWTQLEVLDSFCPLGFRCHRCNSILVREEPSTGDAAGSEKQRNLAQQLERVVQLLQDIENTTVPPIDFEAALSKRLEIQRSMETNPMRQTMLLESNGVTPAGVKGVNQPVVQDLTVDFTSNAEKTAEERASEQDRKAATAAQNMLPVWHTQSTVKANTITHSLYSAKGALDTDTKFETSLEEGKDALLASFDQSDELAAYYARMAQEKEKEAREDLEDEETSDDEDNQGAFEDVSIDPTPRNLQLMSALDGVENLKPPPNAMSESGSSAPASTVTTPAAVMDENEVGAKRIKLGTANGNGNASAASNAVVSDEDEEAEFEDAL
ncbi:MAG: hypothetical protein Q9218_000391 [Villophora microphyllina]